jgi:hypothetical protein
MTTATTTTTTSNINIIYNSSNVVWPFGCKALTCAKTAALTVMAIHSLINVLDSKTVLKAKEQAERTQKPLHSLAPKLTKEKIEMVLKVCRDTPLEVPGDLQAAVLQLCCVQPSV